MIQRIHSFVLAALAASALALGGCATPGGGDQDEVAERDDSILASHLIRIDDAKGDVEGAGAVGDVPATAHPTNIQGPHPDPWTGANGPNGGPHPDPWNPKGNNGEPNPAPTPGGPDDR